MEFISWVSAHTGQNRELCLSAHGHLARTLRYVPVNLENANPVSLFDWNVSCYSFQQLHIHVYAKHITAIFWRFLSLRLYCLSVCLSIHTLVCISGKGSLCNHGVSYMYKWTCTFALQLTGCIVCIMYTWYMYNVLLGLHICSWCLAHVHVGTCTWVCDIAHAQ